MPILRQAAPPARINAPNLHRVAHAFGGEGLERDLLTEQLRQAMQEDAVANVFAPGGPPFAGAIPFHVLQPHVRRHRRGLAELLGTPRAHGTAHGVDHVFDAAERRPTMRPFVLRAPSPAPGIEGLPSAEALRRFKPPALTKLFQDLATSNGRLSGEQLAATLAHLPHSEERAPMVDVAHLTAIAALLSRIDGACPPLERRLLAVLRTAEDGVAWSDGPTPACVRDTCAGLSRSTAYSTASLVGVEQLVAQLPQGARLPLIVELLGDATLVADVRATLSQALAATPFEDLRPHLRSLARPGMRIARIALDASQSRGARPHSLDDAVEAHLLRRAFDDDLPEPLREKVLTALEARSTTEGALPLLRELGAKPDAISRGLKGATMHKLLGLALAPTTTAEDERSALDAVRALALAQPRSEDIERAVQSGVFERVGVPRIAIDIARTHAKQPDDAPLVRGALNATAPMDLARVVRAFAQTTEEADARAAFAGLAPRTQPLPTEASVLDRLSSELASLSNFATVLPAAVSSLPLVDGGTPTVLDPAIARAQPALCVPLLLDRASTPRGAFSTSAAEAALTHAAGSVDAWAAAKLTAASSQTAKLRLGTVQATALALALLDLEEQRDASRAPRDMSAILTHVGKPGFAKDAPTRSAFLASLFRLGCAAARFHARTPDAEWAPVHAALAQAARGDLKGAARAFDDAAKTIRAAHPTADELSEQLRPVLEGKRGAEGVLRFVAGIRRTYRAGVERASLERFTAALTSGTLAIERRKTLRPERFPGTSTDAAQLERIFDGFSAGSNRAGALLLAEAQLAPDDERARWEAVDSSDALDWARAVDDIESCQSTTNTPTFNRGLLNRFEDGSVRLCALRDESGATRARAAMRLAVLRSEQPTEEGRLALVLDMLYTPEVISGRRDSPETVALISAFGRARARELGVPLVLTDGYDELPWSAHPQRTLQLADPIGTDYFDLGNGVTSPGQSTIVRRNVEVVDHAERDAGIPLRATLAAA